MMEAVSTTETSDNSYQTTRCNISEDSHLQLSTCLPQQEHILKCKFFMILLKLLALILFHKDMSFTEE
jgi:hypothetical protein